MNRFSTFVFYVQNIEETIAFYEKAFGLKRRFIDETGHYGELETGSTALAFASEQLGDTNLPRGYRKFTPKELPPGCAITFCTKDVTASFSKALKAGATLVAPLADKPWGQTIGYVRDPNGILIEISSEMHECH